MSLSDSTLVEHCRRLRKREVSATELVKSALSASQRHRNTHAFIHINPQALADAAAADALGPPRKKSERPLHGIPISVKDIFDVAGMETTCGSSFYGLESKLARKDSSYVAAWRNAGAIIVGKTHLNEFAYGLTGENMTLGPCVQARNPKLLTGGSSSGAAASVQEGSSLIGLGTDTGGSIRVPSALCGLVGFRLTPAVTRNRGMFPLAPTFDACGWVQQSLSDLQLVYSALQGSKPPSRPLARARIAFLDGDWLAPCEAPIRIAFERLFGKLQETGARVVWEQAPDFERAPEIFSAIQAYEAARIHRGFLGRPRLKYDPVIRARLEWGLAMKKKELLASRREMAPLCAKISALWQKHDFLLAPACPFARLTAGEDHTAKRRSLLQMTAPFSLASLPALTFPWGPASKKYGWQILARRGQDHHLISLAKSLSQFSNLA